MTIRSWIRNLFTRPVTRPNRKAQARYRPTLEALESRLVPTITLSDLGLSGDGVETAPGVYFLGAGIAPSELQLQQTLNANAADTTNADQLRSEGGLGLNLDGSGVTVAVWDAGDVRTTHQELTGRVTAADGRSTLDDPDPDHATHVSGTIAASGVNPSAKGMAPAATIRAFDFANDLTEMAVDAGSQSLVLSNHSYGARIGWAGVLTINVEVGPDATADVWVGDRSLSATEANGFGKYNSVSQQLDGILFSNPNLLSVWAAGNDRDNTIPGAATHYIAFFSTPLAPDGFLMGFVGPGYYLVNRSVFDAPPSDGNNGTGYDSLPGGKQVAKNNLVVGAINDVTADPYPDPALGM